MDMVCLALWSRNLVADLVLRCYSFFALSVILTYLAWTLEAAGERQAAAW